jgi:hypothetical protein
MKIKLLLFSIGFTFVFTKSSYAGFFINTSFNYQTESASKETQDFGSMKLSTLVGATLGGKGQFVIGPVLTIQSNSNKTSASNTFSSTEFGAKFYFFMGSELNYGIGAGYNISLTGDRVTSSGTEAMQGSSFTGCFTYQFKVAKIIYLGLSMNYHSISLSKVTAGSTTSDDSSTYSYIYPALDLSIRF